MDKHTQNMKPCPFCGGPSLVEYVNEGAYYPRCAECSACGDYQETIEKAVESWNTRNPESDILARDARIAALETSLAAEKEKARRLREALKDAVRLLEKFACTQDEDSFGQSFFKARMSEDAFYIALFQGQKMLKEAEE